MHSLDGTFLQLGLCPLLYRSWSVAVGCNNTFLKLLPSFRVLFLEGNKITVSIKMLHKEMAVRDLPVHAVYSSHTVPCKL